MAVMSNNDDGLVLKPCPFCGSEAHLEQGQSSAWVECDGPGCGADQWHDTPELAAVLWNTRIEHLQSTNDELREALRPFARMAVADDWLAGMNPATLREAVANARAAINDEPPLLARNGTVSITSFDGHCVRIDFATREEAEAMFAALTPVSNEPEEP